MNWLRQNSAKIAILGLVVVALGGLAAALAGPAGQWGLWDFRFGFSLVRWAAYAVVAGGALCLLAVLLAVRGQDGTFLARAKVGIVGTLLAIAVVAVPYLYTLPGNPPIHDVTTDVDDPPAFVDALPLREEAKAPNTAEYLREWPRGDQIIQVTELQKQFFPDIQPLVLDAPPQDVFDRAVQAVDRLNWTLISARPEEGRIEAYEKTRWFGFVDDVVIRVRPEGTGSRVDVRSVSRVGTGDRGYNAKRVRRFLAALSD